MYVHFDQKYSIIYHHLRLPIFKFLNISDIEGDGLLYALVPFLHSYLSDTPFTSSLPLIFIIVFLDMYYGYLPMGSP